MARDRFINWDRLAERPSLEQIRTLLFTYLDGMVGVYVEEIKRHGALHGFFVNLSGKCKRHGEESPRWLEVVIGALSYDVLTREMDDITNDIADGVARLMARKFKGKIEVSDLSNRLLTPAEEKAGVQ